MPPSKIEPSHEEIINNIVESALEMLRGRLNALIKGRELPLQLAMAEQVHAVVAAFSGKIENVLEGAVSWETTMEQLLRVNHLSFRGLMEVPTAMPNLELRLRKTLGEFIERTGLTQKEIADRLGIEQSALSRFLSRSPKERLNDVKFRVLHGLFRMHAGLDQFPKSQRRK